MSFPRVWQLIRMLIAWTGGDPDAETPGPRIEAATTEKAGIARQATTDEVLAAIS